MPRWLLALLLAVLGVIPATGMLPPFWLTLIDNIGLASLVAMGLVLLTGVGGMTSFGQAAFVGFGAYTTAVLTANLGLSPWLSLPVSLLVTGFSALILGLLTVRLAGHYLPLGTLAWALSIYFLFKNSDFLGRNDGVPNLPAPSIAGFALSTPLSMYPLIWISVALAGLATSNLLNSRSGRAIRALRGHGEMARSFGVNKANYKLLVFVYAAMLAGLSGWLYAHLQCSVNPTPFGVEPGMELLFMAVIGGAGQVGGAVLGATVVILLKNLLQRFTPFLVGHDLQLEAVVFGIIILLMLRFARDGLWPRLAGLLIAAPPPLATMMSSEPLAKRPVSPPSDAPLLQLDGVTKRYGGLVAVNAATFGVGRGEIVALIGPNGAGKSTTFDLITGVQPLSAGQIAFDGQPIANATPNRIAALGIGRTFQHTKLVGDMSLLENVALGAHQRLSPGPVSSIVRLDRAPEARLLAEAARQIERVGLSAQQSMPAGSLALGQQRIAEIARALALDPRLLLLDEPAAGLRHFEKVALAELLRSLRTEGLTILLVEHDMGFVMGLVDRIVVLDFGTKIAEGAPQAIRSDPAVIEAYLGGVE